MVFGAVLALTVLGCRKEHTYEPDQTNPPSPTPGATELDPPPIEDEDEDEPDDDDDLTHEAPDDPGSEQEVPPVIEPPVDPDMPEARDPGADPKKPPLPSNRETRG